MNPSPIEWLAVICFFAALLNALCAGTIARHVHRFEGQKLVLHFLHHLSEIEVIFGIWALVYFIGLAFILGWSRASAWFEARNFSEAIFMIAIMLIASTKPVLSLARQGINRLAALLPLPPSLARYLAILTIGPLLGSLITEPAAMTVCALLLHHEVLPEKSSPRLLYSTLAFLFVNISIGGLLTSFAAPPVLMVASHWGWTTPFMFETFGWKALLAVMINAGLVSYINHDELNQHGLKDSAPSPLIPWPVSIFNLIFLTITVLFSHHPALLIASFLIFLDYLILTRAHQGEIRPKSAILVGVFLAGLVILTAEQGFWLKPVLTALQDFILYGSAIGLTAITDNAALTSLAAQVPDLPESARYAILAGAVVGGGLTLIANAPNPAGFSILKSRFHGVLNAGNLLKWAIVPTLIAGGILWIHN